MKRCLLIVTLIYTISVVYAENALNEVPLDLNIGERYEYKTSEIKIESLNIKEKDDEEDYIYRPLKYIKEEFKELYLKKDNDT